MKNSLKMCIAFLFSLFFLSACHKDTAKPNTQSSEYFPNSVGDYWEYDVYDSSNVQQHPTDSRRYTVKVTITGTQKLVDDKDAAVWQYQYPWGNDTNYVRVEGDTVKIFENAYSSTIEYLQFPRIIYIIPFQDRQQWRGKLFGIDTFYVSKEINTKTQFFSFDNSYRIYEYYAGPNIEIKNSYWFKPNVGVIKKYKNEYNLGPLDIQLWQLKKYYLK